METGGQDLILVVDDDQAVRELVARTLATRGWRCETATDGREALAAFGDGRRFAAVVTDRDMPEVGGLALLETLRARAPGVPVVLMSGLLSEETTAQARSHGAAAVIDKERGIRAIADSVEEVFARARAGSSMPSAQCPVPSAQ